jgi:hypothetical protein
MKNILSIIILHFIKYNIKNNNTKNKTKRQSIYQKMDNSTDKEEDYSTMPSLCSDTEDENEDYSDMPALGIATQENIQKALELLPRQARFLKKSFLKKKDEDILKCFLRKFDYDEEEIKELIDEINKTEFPQIKEFVYYLNEILIRMGVNYHGVEFDSMDDVLECKYGKISKFSSSNHEKIRYTFISKIGRLNAEENAAFISDDENDDEMPELEPI